MPSFIVIVLFKSDHYYAKLIHLQMIRIQSQLTITIDLPRPILRIDVHIRMDSKNDFLVLIFALWSEFQSKISVKN